MCERRFCKKFFGAGRDSAGGALASVLRKHSSEGRTPDAGRALYQALCGVSPSKGDRDLPPRFRTNQDVPDISRVLQVCTLVRLQEYVQRCTERFVQCGSSIQSRASMTDQPPIFVLLFCVGRISGPQRSCRSRPSRSGRRLGPRNLWLGWPPTASLITTEALPRRADHPAAICARGEGYRAAAIEVDLGRRGVPMQALKNVGWAILGIGILATLFVAKIFQRIWPPLMIGPCLCSKSFGCSSWCMRL